MKELNQNLAENLSDLFSQLQEEVAKGLENFLLVNKNLLLENV